MTTQILLTSTSLLVTKTKVKAFLSAAQVYFGNYFSDSLFVDNGSDEDGNRLFHFDYQSEVGDSFSGRVNDFAKEAGQYLEIPAEFELREDTMSDERDEYFYTGPDEASTNALKVLCHTRRADIALQPALNDGVTPGTTLYAAMRGLNAVIAAGGHEEIDSRNVLMVTQFGEIYAQGWPGILVVWSEHQDILVAGRMRGDGNADVIGSLNLDTLENLAPSEAKALFENFVQAYSGYGVFQFVDAVPELLSFRPDEEESYSANKPSGI